MGMIGYIGPMHIGDVKRVRYVIQRWLEGERQGYPHDGHTNECMQGGHYGKNMQVGSHGEHMQVGFWRSHEKKKKSEAMGRKPYRILRLVRRDSLAGRVPPKAFLLKSLCTPRAHQEARDAYGFQSYHCVLRSTIYYTSQ